MANPGNIPPFLNVISATFWTALGFLTLSCFLPPHLSPKAGDPRRANVKKTSISGKFGGNTNTVRPCRECPLGWSVCWIWPGTISVACKPTAIWMLFLRWRTWWWGGFFADMDVGKEREQDAVSFGYFSSCWERNYSRTYSILNTNCQENQRAKLLQSSQIYTLFH